MSRPRKKSSWVLPSTAVTWIALGMLLLSLFPELPLHVTHLSLYLLLLLFFTAIYPEVRRMSLHVPGAIIDWEKEVRELSTLLESSTLQMQEIGQSADPHTALLERSRRGDIARRLLNLYQYLQESDELVSDRGVALDRLVRQFTDLDHSHT